MLSQKEIAIDAMLNNHIVLYEFLRCMTGDLIGEGCYRYVFDNPFNKKQVIKIDMGETNSNTIEWDLWNTIKLIPDLAKWFAPCIKMSPCGRVLIMEKADTSKGIDAYPKKIPSFFMDIKTQNFGFINTKLVCIDYGLNLLYVTGEKYKMIDSNFK